MHKASPTSLTLAFSPPGASNASASGYGSQSQAGSTQTQSEIAATFHVAYAFTNDLHFICASLFDSLGEIQEVKIFPQQPMPLERIELQQPSRAFLCAAFSDVLRWAAELLHPVAHVVQRLVWCKAGNILEGEWSALMEAYGSQVLLFTPLEAHDVLFSSIAVTDAPDDLRAENIPPNGALVYSLLPPANSSTFTPERFRLFDSHSPIASYLVACDGSRLCCYDCRVSCFRLSIFSIFHSASDFTLCEQYNHFKPRDSLPHVCLCSLRQSAAEIDSFNRYTRALCRCYYVMSWELPNIAPSAGVFHKVHVANRTKRKRTRKYLELLQSLTSLAPETAPSDADDFSELDELIKSSRSESKNLPAVFSPEIAEKSENDSRAESEGYDGSGSSGGNGGTISDGTTPNNPFIRVVKQTNEPLEEFFKENLNSVFADTFSLTDFIDENSSSKRAQSNPLASVLPGAAGNFRRSHLPAHVVAVLRAVGAIEGQVRSFDGEIASQQDAEQKARSQTTSSSWRKALAKNATLPSNKMNSTAPTPTASLPTSATTTINNSVSGFSANNSEQLNAQQNNYNQMFQQSGDSQQKYSLKRTRSKMSK
jgi:hypothetical protein